jgi:serine/threonine protein phosphatase PrpC
VKVSAAGLTDVGRQRQVNEDHFLLDVERGLYVIADGVGGHKGGVAASRIAVTVVEAYLSRHVVEGIAWVPRELDRRHEARGMLVKALEAANRAILQAATTSEQLDGMGCTLLVALLCGDSLYAIHAGDSRAYRFRDGKLEALTIDHSRVALLVARGHLTVEQARLHPMRNLITKAVGLRKEVQADFTAACLRAGDWLVLCTDGLWEMLSDARIAQIVSGDKDPQQVVSALVSAANRAGGRDNITSIAIRCLQGVGTSETGA